MVGLGISAFYKVGIPNSREEHVMQMRTFSFYYSSRKMRYPFTTTTRPTPRRTKNVRCHTGFSISAYKSELANLQLIVRPGSADSLIYAISPAGEASALLSRTRSRARFLHSAFYSGRLLIALYNLTPVQIALSLSEYHGAFRRASLLANRGFPT